MELVTFHYKINDTYREGRDSIKVKFKDFKYTVDVKPKDFKTKTLSELKEMYYKDALHAAAIEYLSDYAKFIC